RDQDRNRSRRLRPDRADADDALHRRKLAAVRSDPQGRGRREPMKEPSLPLPRSVPLDEIPQVVEADVARIERLHAVGALDAQQIMVGAVAEKIELADRVELQ